MAGGQTEYGLSNSQQRWIDGIGLGKSVGALSLAVAWNVAKTVLTSHADGNRQSLYSRSQDVESLT